VGLLASCERQPGSPGARPPSLGPAFSFTVYFVIEYLHRCCFCDVNLLFQAVRLVVEARVLGVSPLGPPGRQRHRVPSPGAAIAFKVDT